MNTAATPSSGASEVVVPRLSAGDLYRLRKAVASAQRARIRAEAAQQTLREMVLDLERMYGLLGTEASLDVHTGVIIGLPREGEAPEGGAHGH